MHCPKCVELRGAAEAVTGGLDVDAVLVRRDEVVHNWDDSVQLPWLQENGIALVRGHARIAGERRVRAGDRLYEAREAVVLAVGSGAAMPEIPGLADVRPWTNREVTTSREIPPALIVLGGGAVGVEIAQAYSTLGSKVTIIESEERLLAREEPFAGEQLAAALLELGVDVRVAADRSSGPPRRFDHHRRVGRGRARRRERDPSRGRPPPTNRRSRRRHGRARAGLGDDGRRLVARAGVAVAIRDR
jgi:dihydrolipoamide dehydrogenase